MEQKADAHERPLWEQDTDLNIEEPQDLLEDNYEPPPFRPWGSNAEIPPGTGPDDSYYFATDGSIDEAAGKGGYSSVTPHSVDGWEVDSSGAYSARAQGVSCYGAEPVAIDTCELMAVVDILENGPRHHLTLLVDASYIMFEPTQSAEYYSGILCKSESRGYITVFNRVYYVVYNIY